LPDLSQIRYVASVVIPEGESSAAMPRSKKPNPAPVGALEPALDLSSHIPTKIAILANHLSRAASRFYRERYGIGVVEWRLMMFIGHATETRANRICSETDLDKGAVSRSLRMLQRMGIVSVTEDGSDSRRNNVTLTAKGRALHDEIVPVALERQRQMLAGLTPAEIEAFMDVLDRLLARASNCAVPEKPALDAAVPARAPFRPAPRRCEAPKRHLPALRG
jgi:DNA-binding MarR family transcriptional regulator